MPTRDRSGLLLLGAAVLVLAATLSGWGIALAEDGSGPLAASGAALAALVGLAGLITWARSRERQRRMLSGLVDGLISTDPDGRILEVNQAFCDLVGRSRAELVGALPPYVFWPREEHVSWPEVWKQWTDAAPAPLRRRVGPPRRAPHHRRAADRRGARPPRAHRPARGHRS